MLSPNGSSGTCIPDGVYHIPMPCLHGATMPPVRPVREAFTSYGSRESGLLGWVDFSSSLGFSHGQLPRSLGTFVLHPCLSPSGPLPCT